MSQRVRGHPFVSHDLANVSLVKEVRDGVLPPWLRVRSKSIFRPPALWTASRAASSASPTKGTVLTEALVLRRRSSCGDDDNVTEAS